MTTRPIRIGGVSAGPRARTPLSAAGRLHILGIRYEEEQTVATISMRILQNPSGRSIHLGQRFGVYPTSYTTPHKKARVVCGSGICLPKPLSWRDYRS